MPQNGFTVGRDVSLNVVTPQGNLSLNLITSFSAKPDVTDQKIKGLDGITRHVRFPDGWTGGFSLERQDSTLDDYWAQVEANFYAGTNETPCTITETITEASGAVTQYRYVGVLLMLSDPGSFAGDATVKQSLSFSAQRRLKVS